jgi:hypothetical protein
MKVSMNKETIVMKTSLALILFALAGLQAPGLGQEIEHVAKVEDENEAAPPVLYTVAVLDFECKLAGFEDLGAQVRFGFGRCNAGRAIGPHRTNVQARRACGTRFVVARDARDNTGAADGDVGPEPVVLDR